MMGRVAQLALVIRTIVYSIRIRILLSYYTKRRQQYKNERVTALNETPNQFKSTLFPHRHGSICPNPDPHNPELRH
jgi:hypothetical protein